MFRHNLGGPNWITDSMAKMFSMIQAFNFWVRENYKKLWHLQSLFYYLKVNKIVLLFDWILFKKPKKLHFCVVLYLLGKGGVIMTAMTAAFCLIVTIEAEYCMTIFIWPLCFYVHLSLQYLPFKCHFLYKHLWWCDSINV